MAGGLATSMTVTVVVATLESTTPSLTEISMVRGVVSGVPVLLGNGNYLTTFAATG